MTESEKRRIKLLKDTRARYRNKEEFPAVHPRYQGIYHSLYDTAEGDEDEIPSGTLGFRTMLCVIAFIIFAVMDREDESVFYVNSTQIYEAVTQDRNVKNELAEVWKIIKER